MSKVTIVVEDFRSIERGTLRGFATIAICEWRPRLRDIAIHVKGESTWVQLPAKPMMKDGELIKLDGKVKYMAVAEITDREARDAFSRRVIDEILRRYPNALGTADQAIV